MAGLRLVGLGMALPLALCASALLPAVASADRHRHGSGKTKTVTREHTVPKGTDDLRGEAECPKGFRYLRSEWDVDGDAAWRLLTQTDRGITYLMSNFSGSQDAAVTVRITCRKKRTRSSPQFPGDAHSHELLQSLASKPVVLPGRGEFTTVDVSCPSGFSSVNGFFDIPSEVRVETSTPTDSGWQFGVSNLTNDAQTNATAGVQCVGKETGPAVRGAKKNCNKVKDPERRAKCRKRHRHAVRREVVEVAVSVPPSPKPTQSGVPAEGNGRCPTGMFPAGVGWNFQGHPFTFLNGFRSGAPLTSGARASALAGAFDLLIFNRSTDQEAKVLAVCLGEETGAAG